jgi:hypothetical protein
MGCSCGRDDRNLRPEMNTGAPTPLAPGSPPRKTENTMNATKCLSTAGMMILPMTACAADAQLSCSSPAVIETARAITLLKSNGEVEGELRPQEKRRSRDPVWITRDNCPSCG